MPKFIVKKRQSDGMYVYRSIMGTKRGLRWGKWTLPVDPCRFDTLEEAVARAKQIDGGLLNVAVFHRGKKVWENYK